MLIGIIGESCTGKTTLADQISRELGAEVFSGNDYLRLAKTESEARMLFAGKLGKAVSGENVIFVISEPEQVKLLPRGAVRVLVSADLDTIKERFRMRMHGSLPDSIVRMLERKHGIFDSGTYEFRFDGGTEGADDLCRKLKAFRHDG